MLIGNALQNIKKNLYRIKSDGERRKKRAGLELGEQVLGDQRVLICMIFSSKASPGTIALFLILDL
jgi:hypothetical protein